MADDWDPIHSGDGQNVADFAGHLLDTGAPAGMTKHEKNTRLLFLFAAIFAGGCRAMDLSQEDFQAIAQAAWRRMRSAECQRR